MVDHERIWQGLDAELFRFATTERRELHIALMLAFEHASVLEPALGVDGVRAALQARGWHQPVTDALLHEALSYLTADRLLEATQDHGARYSTPEEFERRNLQWSLTQRGQAAAAGLLRVYEMLRHTASLQPAVLAAMADALEELAALVDGTAVPDERRAFTRLGELERHHSSVMDNVSQFNRHLQRLLREDATTDDVFYDVKRRTIRYLEEYVSDIEQPARRLRGAVERVQRAGPGALFDLALRGANLASFADDDPAPRWLADRARRWAALETWFGPQLGGVQPRIAALQAIAREAIMQLLRVLERRIDLRRRSTSIAADFRVLAEWFAAAPDEMEAHRLWGAAFGAWPSRHLQHQHEDAEDVHRSVSWLAAPAVGVPPSLRTSGTLGPRGKVAPVRSGASVRARRQARHAELVRQAEQLRALLRTDGPVRLRDGFATLDPLQFRELLALLGRALAAVPSADGRRRATSSDGSVEIVLDREPPDGWAAIRIAAGTLWAPNHLVEISTPGAPAVARSGTGAVLVGSSA